ncbi:minor capsid protein [Endozoicomonas sp. GU-1]|uniref:phage head morphogenesis protein n=1 Tax=Endozoicomonas sp. GU-1 TaxID=3009078 RepID=UPI0022B52956|nr:minor capsid protein [Endozoicomonas sp. GU-1]WBA79562.1 minor capsid protein [Endozoicomonas sp. GU-1]
MDITDNSIKFQTLIEQLKSSEIASQNKVFNLLQKELRAAIAASDDIDTKAHLKALQKEIEQLISSILGDYSNELSNTLELLVPEAANMELASLSSVAPEAVVFKTVDTAALWSKTRNRALMVKGYTGDLLLESFIKDWIRPEVQRINNAVTQAYLEGRTNRELIDAILGTRSMQYRDGMLVTTRRSADAIARTAIQHVASTTRQLTWEANQDLITAYQFNATLDSRTSATCRALDGRVFDFGKGPTPPLHIRCRSTTIPVLSEKYDWLSEGQTRASKGGYVSADESYYSWLKRQPTGFIEGVLGSDRAKLFKNGGLNAEEFAKLQLDKNFKPLTLEQMRDIAPEVFKRAGL